MPCCEAAKPFHCGYVCVCGGTQHAKLRRTAGDVKERCATLLYVTGGITVTQHAKQSATAGPLWASVRRTCPAVVCRRAITARLHSCPVRTLAFAQMMGQAVRLLQVMGGTEQSEKDAGRDTTLTQDRQR